MQDAVDLRDALEAGKAKVGRRDAAVLAGLVLAKLKSVRNVALELFAEERHG
jgi:hypothetical protein